MQNVDLSTFKNSIFDLIFDILKRVLYTIKGVRTSK